MKISIDIDIPSGTPVTEHQYEMAKKLASHAFLTPSVFNNETVAFAGDGMICTRPSIDFGHEFDEAFDRSLFLKTPSHIHRFKYVKNRAALYAFGVQAAFSLFPEDNCHMVECGVWYGLFSLVALQLLKETPLSTRRRFFLIDAFGEQIDSSLQIPSDKYYSDGDIFSVVEQRFEGTIAKLIKGMIPEVLSNQMLRNIESLSFISMDLNSVEAEEFGFNFFFPKLRKGGFIYIDDYGCKGYEETRAFYDKALKGRALVFKTWHSSALAIKVAD